MDVNIECCGTPDDRTLESRDVSRSGNICVRTYVRCLWFSYTVRVPHLNLPAGKEAITEVFWWLLSLCERFGFLVFFWAPPRGGRSGDQAAVWPEDGVSCSHGSTSF